MSRQVEAVTVLAGLVDPVGRWGDHATDEQWSDARAILDPEADRRRHWLGRAKGYSKTRDAAGASIAALLTQFPAGATGYVAASDADQAGLVRQSIAAFVEGTPGLESQLRVDQRRVTARSGAELVILAADSSGSHGLRPYWLVADELANWPDVPRHREFFDSLWAGLAKVRGSRGIVITTAGSPAHFSRRIFETAETEPGWRLSDLRGPAPWTDSAELESERRRLPASVFQRWWENEWSAAEDSIADPDDVAAACCLAGPRAPEEGRKYVCSLDLGVRHDRSVAVIAHAERDGETRRVVVDQLKVWKPTRLRPVQLEDVKAWLLEFTRLYGARLLYDPSQAYLLVEQLRASRIRCQEFTFTTSSVGMLATALMQALRSQSLDLPDDEELKAELLAVRLRETSPNVLRLDHSSGGHDDQAVTVGMAVHFLFHDVPKRKAKMVAAGRLPPIRDPAKPGAGMRNDPMIVRPPRRPGW